MTEPLAPLSDEDLSAALDGVAGPDVEARIQADPSAQERLAALRAASNAIGRAPAPALDPGTVDALVARAIAEGTSRATGSEPSLSTPPTSPDGVVTPLAPRRRSSAGRQQWLVAAVVVALVAIGLGLVYSGTRQARTETTATGAQADRNAARNGTTTVPSAEDASGDGAAPSHSGAQPDLDPSAQKPAALDQLGSFDDVSALRTVLRAGFPQDPSPVVGDRPTNASVNRCSSQIQTVLGEMALSPEPDEVGYATIAGKKYLVYEFSITGSSTVGSKLITAAEPESCDLLFNFVR